jgi:DNA-binding NarL/FixJ family response regulator
MEIIQIIIADPSPLARIGLTALTERLGFPVHIREAGSNEKLEQISYRFTADLVFISASLFQGLTEAKINSMVKRYNQTRLILIAGLTGEISSDFRFHDRIEAADTEKNISRKIERQLVILTRKHESAEPTKGLSNRERDVLRYVALGCTNKEIADKLYISTHTVITHRKNITAKVGIKTIAGLTVYAVLNKLINIEEIE